VACHPGRERRAQHTVPLDASIAESYPLGIGSSWTADFYAIRVDAKEKTERRPVRRVPARRCSGLVKMLDDVTT
jgi:hypothetical protein